ncbi:MAG: hypothetical protein IJE26_04810 [Oscillospiraceae bacterium]|nr:hypothetical protein [Oscillospiraceae bacterium]
MLVAVRLTLLLCSFSGYLCRLSRRIRAELAVGFMLSAIGSLLFVAGIFGMLQEAAWVIFLGGLYFFYADILKGKKLCVTPGLIFLGCLSAFFLLLLYGSQFLHYDNFSHWAVATQVLTARDNFPNMGNTTIMFQSYPLGSAAYIYYVTEIAGCNAEWMQMWAQAGLMAGMGVCLFAFCRHWVHGIAAAAGILILLAGNTPLTDLLVDTLLPLTALNALAFFLYYREELEDRICYAIAYAVFLMSIKNSGMLFAAFLLLYILVHLERSRDNIRKWLVAAAAPLAVYFFWEKHVDMVFDRGLLAKHSMSIGYMARQLYHKSLADIWEIIKLHAGTVFSLSNPVLPLLALGLLLWLFCLAFAKGRKRQTGELLVWVFFFYVVYQLGTFGMYIFSMPSGEALKLAGYDRYHETILVFLGGLLLIGVLRCSEDLSFKNAGITAAALLLLVCSLTPDWSYYQKQVPENNDRTRMESLMAEYGIKGGGSYLIVTNDAYSNGEYLYFLSRYLLSSADIEVLPASQLTEDAADGYDYVILFEESEEGLAYMTALTGGDSGRVLCQK